MANYWVDSTVERTVEQSAALMAMRWAEPMAVRWDQN